ncbi:MAG: dihydrodipicolinate reductase [Deltaproteobacteria bacterium]|nr:dihydrodipicolinate reductase [Deltaproteobacteria bacterium]
MDRIRVIVWGTGFVGLSVLRNLITHPAYEVAGVLVNDPAKDGRDVGALAGLPEAGLTASRDAEEVLSRPADAVCYFGPSALHMETNLANLTRALRAGKNVVETTVGALQNPERAPDVIRDTIEAACQDGGTTFFSGGIDPGFGNDLLPLTLLGLCGRVDRVHTTEFLDAGSYPDQASLASMGLCSSLGDPALLDTPGLMTSIWGGPLYMIAKALGVEVSETVEIYERWATPSAIDFERGRVEAGCAAAHRIKLSGVVDGEERIVIDHIHRVVPDIAPDWPRPASDPAHANRVEITGSPNIAQETVLADEFTGDGNAGGCLATGMRAVNALPPVVAAAPGILSTLDLPMIAGTGGMGHAKALA